jgi:hypothetical protein
MGRDGLTSTAQKVQIFLGGQASSLVKAGRASALSIDSGGKSFEWPARPSGWQRRATLVHDGMLRPN